MFSGFLFADSVEIAKELSTQLYEKAKITLPKLDLPKLNLPKLKK